MSLATDLAVYGGPAHVGSTYAVKPRRAAVRDVWCVCCSGYAPRVAYIALAIGEQHWLVHSATAPVSAPVHVLFFFSNLTVAMLLNGSIGEISRSNCAITVDSWQCNAYFYIGIPTRQVLIQAHWSPNISYLVGASAFQGLRAALMGRVKNIRVPSPSLLSARMVPPWASTIQREM